MEITEITGILIASIVCIMLITCALLFKARGVYEIEDGYIGVMARGNRTKFVKPGKYILSRSKKCVYKIPTTVQIVSDNHCKDGTTRTKDGYDIGFSYDVECQVVDPKLFYKKRIVGLEFQNTRRAVYEILRNKIRHSTHDELVQEIILKHNGVIELNGQELLKIDSAQWGVQIFKIVFKPHIHGTDYEYWAAFCDYAKKIPQFNQHFTLPSVDYDEILNLWSYDRRYTINLWRDKSEQRVCVEFLVANDNGYFETVVARETEIESKLQWDVEWNEQKNRAFSIVRIVKNMGGQSIDKSLWDKQFEWMAEKSIVMKEIVSDVIDANYGSDNNAHPTKRELIQCVCKRCGAPLNNSTRVCEYCGMGHVEIIMQLTANYLKGLDQMEGLEGEEEPMRLEYSNGEIAHGFSEYGLGDF